MHFTENVVDAVRVGNRKAHITICGSIDLQQILPNENETPNVSLCILYILAKVDNIYF